jgi:hypothetical protein
MEKANKILEVKEAELKEANEKMENKPKKNRRGRQQEKEKNKVRLTNKIQQHKKKWIEKN